MLIEKKEHLKRIKKTREMAANFKLFADRTNVRKPKKKTTIKGIKWVRIKRDTSGDLSQLKT
jgi:hypothetical protein